MNKKKNNTATAKQKLPQNKKQLSGKISKQQWLFLLLLFIAIFIVYLHALNKEFINYDDDLYITNNPYIKNFSFSKIPEIFSNFYYAQYSPLATVLYGIIHSIVGFKPFLYNLTSILLHIIATLLVFKLIWEISKNYLVAFFTAAFFGFSAIQVESVAWLAAVFKTSGYSIFFLSSLILYTKYAKTGKSKFYLFSILLFIISFFFKEQSVALSLAVVCIDIFLERKLLSKKVLLEKIPFFVLSVGLGMVSIAAAASYQEVGTTSFPLYQRIIYACYALVNYIFKTFVPVNLAMFYPYPSLKNFGFIHIFYPLVVLVIIGLWLWAFKRKQKSIFFGGLFFLTNILFALAVQVISVRQVVMADRYMYLASIGLFFILANAGISIIEKKKKFSIAIYLFFIAFLLFQSVMTYSRVQTWKDSVTVYTHLIKYNDRLDIAYRNRGNYYRDHNMPDLALKDYTKLIEVKPNDYSAYNSRGKILFDKRKYQEALKDFTRSIELNPSYAEALSNRGAVLATLGRYQEALNDFNKALSLDSMRASSYTNRALTLEMMGKYEEALKDYQHYLKLKPNDAQIYNSIGVLKQKMKKHKESLEDFDKAISIEPNGIFYLSRSYSWNALGNKDKALADALQAQKMGVNVDQQYLEFLKKN